MLKGSKHHPTDAPSGRSASKILTPQLLNTKTLPLPIILQSKTCLRLASACRPITLLTLPSVGQHPKSKTPKLLNSSTPQLKTNHSPTHSLNRSLTHSLTHSLLTHTPAHSGHPDRYWESNFPKGQKTAHSG
jgi:hypothetical protein